MVNHHNFPRTGGHPANPEGKAGSRPDPGGSAKPGRNQTPADSPTLLPRPAQVQPAVDRGTPPTRPASPGRRRPGQPAPRAAGRVPWAALPAALAVRGSCGPWPCPARPRPKPCRPPPGTSRIPGEAHAADPGNGPRRAPVLGGIRIRGALRLAGRETSCPRPGRCHCPRRYAAGGPAGSRGPCCPQSGPNRQQPAPPPGAGRAPAAGSAKAAVTTVAPGPRQTRIWSATCRTSHRP